MKTLFKKGFSEKTGLQIYSGSFLFEKSLDLVEIQTKTDNLKPLSLPVLK